MIIANIQRILKLWKLRNFTLEGKIFKRLLHKYRIRSSFYGELGKQMLLMPKLIKGASIHERYLLKLDSRANFF